MRRRASRRLGLGIVLVAIAVSSARPAHAADEAPPAGATPASSSPPSESGDPSYDANAIRAQLEKDKPSAALENDAPEPPPEAPPPPPYKKTLVLDSSIGVLTFLGKFGSTAPPAAHLRTQLGYEFLKWLMVFAEGELALTDTSRSQPPPRTRAFPIYGFGVGARVTVRFTHRFGAFVQGSAGLMKADIRSNALGIIGYEDAEDLGLYFAGRLGLEWYQLDRHFALGINSGIRNAAGFKRVNGSDTPLALDAGVAIRYAF